MKKANTLLSTFLLVSLSFSAAIQSGINFNKDMKLAVNTSEDVYGIQFDMRYDASQITIEELNNTSSLISGVDIFSKVKEPGFVRVVMFSMDLNKISAGNELSDIIDFNITPADSYVQSSSVTFENIILAGANGQELDYQDSFVYELSATDLIPTTTELSNIYPNPFNPSTTIDYNLNASSDVSIVIYDMKGSIVRTLVSNYQDAGLHQITWNGKNDFNSQVSSGMYLVRMDANGQVFQQAITLLK